MKNRIRSCMLSTDRDMKNKWTNHSSYSFISSYPCILFIKMQLLLLLTSLSEFLGSSLLTCTVQLSQPGDYIIPMILESLDKGLLPWHLINPCLYLLICLLLPWNSWGAYTMYLMFCPKVCTYLLE